MLSSLGWFKKTARSKMSKFRKVVLTAVLLAASGWVSAQSTGYPGVGRPATAKEIAAWDIDVRPDFKGLPKGAGSVAQGQDLWEAKCASCHGVFGESNEVFSPLVGGTTKDDIKTGNVANLKRDDFPGRTTMMKVSTLSTLWDYINRAMPWTAPKSLKPDEVYAVTAYLLSLADVVPENFVLSDKNIAEIQKRMPNRNGMTTKHAMWPGKEFNGTSKPDTANVACMKDCVPEAKVASMLPDYARNAHGNLAEQNRLVGQQHGANTAVPENKSASIGATVTPVPAKPVVKVADPALALLSKHNCTACHAQGTKIVGPSFNDIAKKYAGKVDYLAGKIKVGGSGVWGPIPMPAQNAPDGDIKTMANWLAAGAAK
jgi:cytochrome c551/c552/cytochrome c553